MSFLIEKVMYFEYAWFDIFKIFIEINNWDIVLNILGQQAEGFSS